MNEKPGLLKVCGIWVLLLGLAPVIKTAFFFVSVLPRISEIGLSNFFVIVQGTVMPDHVWIIRELGTWMARPLPIAAALPFVTIVSSFARLLNVVIQLMVVVVGVALLKGKSWSRLGFLIVFGWAFVFHFLQQVWLLAQRANALGVASVAFEGTFLTVAWVTPILLFGSPTVRTFFGQKGADGR